MTTPSKDIKIFTALMVQIEGMGLAAEMLFGQTQGEELPLPTCISITRDSMMQRDLGELESYKFILDMLKEANPTLRLLWSAKTDDVYFLEVYE